MGRKDLEIEICTDRVILKQIFGNGKKQVLIKAKSLREIIEKLENDLDNLIFGKGDW
jgi:hypothetical protein